MSSDWDSGKGYTMAKLKYLNAYARLTYNKLISNKGINDKFTWGLTKLIESSRKWITMRKNLAKT